MTDAPKTALQYVEALRHYEQLFQRLRLACERELGNSIIAIHPLTGRVKLTMWRNPIAGLELWRHEGVAGLDIRRKETDNGENITPGAAETECLP